MKQQKVCPVRFLPFNYTVLAPEDVEEIRGYPLWVLAEDVPGAVAVFGYPDPYVQLCLELLTGYDWEEFWRTK